MLNSRQQFQQPLDITYAQNKILNMQTQLWSRLDSSFWPESTSIIFVCKQ